MASDILDPRTQGFSVSPYPPELQGEAAALHRRRALADMLMLRAIQPMPQPTGYGGIPVPISPLAGLSHMVQMGLGVRAGSGVDQGEAALAGRYSSGLEQATTEMQDAMSKGDFKTAGSVASRWPALKSVATALFQQQLPKPVIHTTFGPGGTEQPAVVNLNQPEAPPVPIGGMKSPPLHPTETVGPGGLPQTSFLNLNQPELAPVAKPAPLHAANLGGTTKLFSPYGPERDLQHTLDPNRVPTLEDIEANAKMIAEYRMPGYTGNAARTPGGGAVMRRVSELNPQYDAAIFPVAKAGEINFIEKNGPQIRAFGTLARHAEAAKDLFTALDNPTDIRRLNQAYNFFREEFGVAAPTQVSLAKQFIADEMAKAVLNGPGALDDRKHFAEALSRSASKAQFAGDLDTTMKFAVEQMKGHEQQYKSMTKSNRADFQERFLDPQMKAIYNKYGGGRRSADQTPGLPDPAAVDAELRRRGVGG
jgi:hypothetical protein